MTNLADAANVYDKSLRAVFEHDINKGYDNNYKGKIFHVYDTTETTEKFTSMEAMTAPEYLAEGQTIPLARTGQGYDSILTSKKYGQAIQFTWDMLLEIENGTVKVAREINRQKNIVVKQMHRFPEVEAFKMLNNGFATNIYQTSATPNIPVTPASVGEQVQLAPDGNPIFGQHVWNSTSNGFQNQALNNPTLSSASLERMRRYAANGIRNAEGRRIKINFDTLIVQQGSAAHDEAIRIINGTIHPTETADVNILKGTMNIIAVPWIDNERAWYAYDSKYMERALSFKWRKKPTLMKPHVDSSNESIRWNTLGKFGYGCIDMPVAWYGSNGSGVN